MQDTAGEVGTSSLVMYSYGPLHMVEEKKTVERSKSEEQANFL